MTCIVDCLTEYSDGSIIEEPYNEAIFSPYVIVRFGDKMITVGNNSAPPNNHATISSFQYGFGPGTTGFGAEFEIIDQGGIMYEDIIRAMNKTITKAKDEAMQISFDFGWIVKNCDDVARLETAHTISGKNLHGIITKLEQSFEGGKIKLKFKIEGVQNRIPDIRHDDTIGDESEKIALKDALIRLFTESEPKFASVEFKSRFEGEEFEFKNSDDSDDGRGPKGAWPINQQNSLAAARSWLSSVTTKDNKGIQICYDADSSSIVFQEDKSDNGCDGSNSIGTYIVNGGNCSPVLEFNPTVTWQLGGIPGGGATSASTGSGNNGEDVVVKPNSDVQQAGTQTGPSIQQHESMWRSPEDLAEKSSQGNAAHMEANFPLERPLPGFSAQLKLHGSPQFSDPIAMIAQTVSIIVINPFHIDNQCVWITGPNCNPILSNKKYYIRGVNHQISGGSFVTTLEVFLPQPNDTIDAIAPLGGCGTETFSEGLGASEATEPA